MEKLKYFGKIKTYFVVLMTCISLNSCFSPEKTALDNTKDELTNILKENDELKNTCDSLENVYLNFKKKGKELSKTINSGKKDLKKTTENHKKAKEEYTKKLKELRFLQKKLNELLVKSEKINKKLKIKKINNIDVGTFLSIGLYFFTLLIKKFIESIKEYKEFKEMLDGKGDKG